MTYGIRRQPFAKLNYTILCHLKISQTQRVEVGQVRNYLRTSTSRNSGKSCGRITLHLGRIDTMVSVDLLQNQLIVSMSFHVTIVPSLGVYLSLFIIQYFINFHHLLYPFKYPSFLHGLKPPFFIAKFTINHHFSMERSTIFNG